MKDTTGGFKFLGYLSFPLKGDLPYIPRFMNQENNCCALIYMGANTDGSDKFGNYEIRQCSIRATHSTKDADFCGNHYNCAVDRHHAPR